MKPLLLAILLAACAAPATVARVRVLRGDSAREGTAVLVRTHDGKSYYLTNEHVVRDAVPSEVAVGNASTLDIADVHAFDTWNDLHVVIDAAVLTVSEVSAAPASPRLGRWDPAPGEEVVVETTRGTFTGKMRPRAGGGYQLALDDGEIVSGDSGSAVYANGDLVGLIFASSVERERVALLTPLWAIRKALSEHRLRWVVE